MNAAQFYAWLARKSQPDSDSHFEKPLIMGVLNATPDSFSDGGAYSSVDSACERIFSLLEQGVDLIDIGGESSRPGAAEVSASVELNRIIPIIEQIRVHSDVCISIDSYKPEVMQAAVNAGATMINDIYALRSEAALEMAVQLDVPVCLMHMQGTPTTMQVNPNYPAGVLAALDGFFEERMVTCSKAGMDENKLILDPGFGFGKNVEHNLKIINKLDYFKKYNKPLLLGVSRKSLIGAVLNKPVEKRLVGGIALSVYAAIKGVGILRTHDVDETNQALQMIEAVCNAS
jgi:dihydropteroate synthase